MAFLKQRERDFLAAVSEAGYCNPFTRQRIDAERRALGRRFNDADAEWNRHHAEMPEQLNVRRILDELDELIPHLRQRMDEAGADSDAAPTADELRIYEDAVLFKLYHRLPFDQTIAAISAGRADRPRIAYYSAFRDEAKQLLDLPDLPMPAAFDPAHLFACLFAIRRAFHHIFHHLLGASEPTARLRAAVWQSIFTHDMRRYRRVLYNRMVDVTTLITGPSGTGKELVARAIGLARYIPFNEKQRTFAADFAGTFYPVNLAALSSTLIESELFGHRRGSFTGAVDDRAGYLEACGRHGTVFLDEIGEVDPGIQVKLLRVLQSRKFQRLGDTAERRFDGKLLAATNRDVAQRMHMGAFRPDFYYRLCSDQIVTPSLREQLADRPEDRRTLVHHFARRMVGDEAESLTDEVEPWIDAHLGPDYAWPGNVRELEQCVRNVMIRRWYQPAAQPQTQPNGVLEELSAAVCEGRLSADALLGRYCTLVFARTGSYVAAAEQLGLDRRTVKARIDQAWLNRLHAEGVGLSSSDVTQ